MGLIHAMQSNGPLHQVKLGTTSSWFREVLVVFWNVVDICLIIQLILQMSQRDKQEGKRLSTLSVWEFGSDWQFP